MEPSTLRRVELLGAIVSDFLDHGVGELSLRPLAEQVGTSARLLIYHFESKEQLVASALAEVRRHLSTSLSEQLRLTQPETLRELITTIFEWTIEPPNSRYFRLLFEVDGLAMYDRISFSTEAKRANSRVWTALIEQSVAKVGAVGIRGSAQTTLMMCTIAGLLQEFLSTGDRERTLAALGSLFDFIEASPRSREAPAGKRA